MSFPQGAFNGLHNVEDLFLWANELSIISCDMFLGLESVKSLNLNNNDIRNIEPGAFANMKKLEGLYIPNNELTTVSFDMFGSNGRHPQKLEMLLHRNPLHCDSKLCWLVEGERDGWLTFDSHTIRYSPKCTNFPGVHWLNVTLDCDSA